MHDPHTLSGMIIIHGHAYKVCCNVILFLHYIMICFSHSLSFFYPLHLSLSHTLISQKPRETGQDYPVRGWKGSQPFYEYPDLANMDLKGGFCNGIRITAFLIRKHFLYANPSIAPKRTILLPDTHLHKYIFNEAHRLGHSSGMCRRSNPTQVQVLCVVCYTKIEDNL